MTDPVRGAAQDTLLGVVNAHHDRDPSAVVLLTPDGHAWTRDDLHQRSLAWVEALRMAGVAPGDRVVLSCDPRLDTAAAYLGVLRCGAIVVPANTGYTERELAYIAGDAGPIAAIVDDARRAQRWMAVGVPVIAPPPESEMPSTMTGAEPPLAQARPGDAALIGYTSGTTGSPKGAVLTHANLLSGARSVVAAWEWTEADRLVLALPLFHMHGLGVGVNGTLAAGASAVILPAFDVDAVLDAGSRFRATMFFGVPTMYARLARSPRVAELASLRVAVSGSAPLPPAVWQRIREASGVEVLERYGMTETVMLASNPLHGQRRSGSVGRALPGVELRIGDGGVVEVRGDNVFSGYLDRPEATADAFTADGWFRTGDVGVIDADGYVTLVGRASELIISGGYNVYPREVEDVLRAHPEVSDVAVVGLPDEEWGEVVTAFVVLADDELAQAGEEWATSLDAHARQELAGFKVPRRWHRIDSLPRNAMGKVVRHELPASPPS